MAQPLLRSALRGSAGRGGQGVTGMTAAPKGLNQIWRSLRCSVLYRYPKKARTCPEEVASLRRPDAYALGGGQCRFRVQYLFWGPTHMSRACRNRNSSRSVNVPPFLHLLLLCIP